ncbi:MAG: DUF4440 domain-containing protein [Phycisphaerales bacterium]|nr:DUF4440 domain-containing protein [Phycisphaerales bacterium]
MRRVASLLLCLTTCLVSAGCACNGTCDDTAQATASAAAGAHEAYVDAINSNDGARIMAMLTDDIVFMPPNQPRLVGKDALAPWVDGYLQAYRTHWDKTVLEFVVSGRWAFEQYAYQSTDTPRAGGDVLRDTGKGLIVYRRDADGVWRVARDAWNSDLP